MKKVNYEKIMDWKKELKKEDYFLDLGCWSGETVLELDKKCNSYGLDIDEKKINLANKKIASKLKVGDATKEISFKEKFDWILCSEVIEHIKEDQLLLENISSSLKVGGKLILTTPRKVFLFDFWDPAWILWKLGGKERHHHYSLKELNRKLLKSGLEIKEYAIRGDFIWMVKRWINSILKKILRSNLKFKNNFSDGFAGWVLRAEKIK